jgi:ornithine carbamoyltransferase
MASASSSKNKKRDFLTLKEYSSAQIRHLFELTKQIKQNPQQYSDSLKGKELAMLFQKTSTRTRVSFEVAMHSLGGNAIYLDWRTTNFTLGALEDEIRCLSRYIHIILARVYDHKDIEIMAKHATVPVINGLSNQFHPCQALADLYTIYELIPSYETTKIVFLGDGSNNVATSLAIICARLNITLTISSPSEYNPQPSLLEWLEQENLQQYLIIDSDPNHAVKDANVLYTDTFVSMGQENETEHRLPIFKPYQINDKLIQASGTNPKIMHCLPAHRGVEIASDLLDSPQSIIFEQAENRLHTQKALLFELLSEKK